MMVSLLQLRFGLNLKQWTGEPCHEVHVASFQIFSMRKGPHKLHISIQNNIEWYRDAKDSQYVSPKMDAIHTVHV